MSMMFPGLPWIPYLSSGSTAALTSNLNAILERVAAIQMTIPGIQWAYAYTPADPSSAQVPFFVNTPAAGLANSSNFMAQNLYRLDNVIEMWLCIAPWQMDATQSANLQNTYKWRDVVFTTFAQHLRLSLVSGAPDLVFIIDGHITAWSIDKKTVGATDWAALGFKLTVKEALPVNVTT